MMQINRSELGYQFLLRGQSRTRAKGGDTGKMISSGSLFPKPMSNGCILRRVDHPSRPVDWERGQTLTECRIDDYSDSVRRCGLHERRNET